MNNRKVKSLLINKEFQLTFIILNGVLLTLLTLGYALAIYLFFDNFFTLGLENGLSEDHIFFQFISKQRTDIFIFFTITYISSLILFLYISFKISHKVAGPLYRLNEHLKEVVETGSLKEIKFRKGDYFMEIQDNFNKMVERTNAK